VAIAKVKARFRPWRSIFLLVLAVAMATVSRSARTAAASVFFPETAYRGLGHTGTEALADAAAVAFCLLAYLGTAGLAGQAAQQSLSNVFAGMVLLLARPVDVGDPVLIRCSRAAIAPVGSSPPDPT